MNPKYIILSDNMLDFQRLKKAAVILPVMFYKTKSTPSI